MENFFAAAADWISTNESLLSGMVAIAVLASLAYTALRRLRPASHSGEPVSSIDPTRQANAEDSVPEQEIRYCHTSDGKRIAYAVTGEGAPIVRALGWFTHLEAEWNSPIGRGFWQRLGGDHRLVRYDGRGMGLSEATTEFSAEARLSDLEAVIEAAGLDQFALFGISEGTRTALRYAAKNPDRVTQLVLYGCAVVKNGKWDDEMVQNFRASRAMIEAGWGRNTHTKFFADLFLGQGAAPEEVNYFVEIMKRSADRETAIAYYQSLAETDQGFELAQDIRVPTLVIHPEHDQVAQFQWSRDLAAEIPGARFKPLVGDSHFLMLDSERSQSGESIRAIESFLQEP
jgi:pimeloyl-ACP methyl ester carboxylesterase